MIVDIINVGWSPLLFDTLSLLPCNGVPIRIIPFVYLFEKPQNAPTVYDPTRLFKSELSNYILKGSQYLQGNMGLRLLSKVLLSTCFWAEYRYPANPLIRASLLSKVQQLTNVYKKVGLPSVLFFDGFFNETALLTMHLHHTTGIPYIMRLHSSDFMMQDSRKSRYLKKVYEDTIAVTTISDYNRKWLKRRGFVIDKVHVIRAGVNVERFKRTKQYNADGPLLYVGRLVRCKGIEYLIKAMVNLKDYFPHLYAKIVGEGPMLSELKELTVSLDIKDRVEFVGHVGWEALKDVYESASIFVHPSVELEDGRVDGIPVSMMEAMAMELPVVSTWCSGIPELVDHGVNGLLVRQRDDEGLAEAIRYLLENQSVAEGMGGKAREKVEREYDIAKNAAKLAYLFKKVADGCGYD